MNPRLSAPEADALSAELRAPPLRVDYTNADSLTQEMVRRHMRIAAFRDVTLTNARRKVLGYAEQVAIRSAPRSTGTIGLVGVTFAPAAARYVFSRQIPVVTIDTIGRSRLQLRGIRFSIASDALPASTGG